MTLAHDSLEYMCRKLFWMKLLQEDSRQAGGFSSNILETVLQMHACLRNRPEGKHIGRQHIPVSNSRGRMIGDSRTPFPTVSRGPTIQFDGWKK
eukprot:scaffold2308_cov103-Cylindrotheca_fusiformis.AAC.7